MGRGERRPGPTDDPMSSPLMAVRSWPRPAGAADPRDGSLPLAALDAGEGAPLPGGDRLLGVLDALDQGIAFMSRSGSVQQANRAFLLATGSTPDGERLLVETRHVAVATWGAANYRRIAAGTENLETRTLQLAAGDYRLTGTFIAGDVPDQARIVLVSVRSLPRPPLSPEALRERYGLTRREAGVARLLVQGLRTGEIAQRLWISPHTARHHIEKIKTKVGGRTRVAVAALILQLEE